ncbi:acetate--CoA ligase family protein [Nocardia vaccinii]|uniref:acetate--CoA ligase family protein n=1 Tax=Nocardia vaccinii TaxID=1822 RepID=UPI000A016515|nr:acetate--CoA ligase family protein [Nocardia vaccinii]
MTTTRTFENRAKLEEPMNTRNRPSRTGAPTDDSSVRRVLNPQSVAVIGASAKPGSVTGPIIANLERNGYQGTVHLVGRTPGTVGERPILTSIEDLPDGIDLAILSLPAEAVLPTLEQIADKQMGGAVVFASGFAEMGEQGSQLQCEIAEYVRAHALRLVGPNTVGYFNYVDSFHVSLVDMGELPPMRRDLGPGLGVVTQSGSIGAHVAGSLLERGVPVSYTVTTGNEADLGLSHMVDFFATDPHTGGVAIYAEQVRDPAAFLAAVTRARAAGKHVTLMHSGRSAASKETTQSHTGALAGDYEVIKTVMTAAGVAVVESLEELLDVSQLLLRYPQAPVGGIGVITSSGAVCGIAQDYSAGHGLAMPALSEAGVETLRADLPPFLPSRNPLDLGTLLAVKPELLDLGLEVFSAEDAFGSLLVSIPLVNPVLARRLMEGFVKTAVHGEKPAVFVIQCEDHDFWPDFERLAIEEGAVLMRSPERAIRALAALTNVGQSWAATNSSSRQADGAASPLPAGSLAEWQGKKLLREYGVDVPAGDLANSAEEAVELASKLGWPVVLKAQSSNLAHKTEAGAVAVGIPDETSLRARFEEMQQRVSEYAPGLELDGYLIETMAQPGVELVIGARRDPDWGPVVLLGLGGIWTETLADVRLLVPGATHAAILTALTSLRGAALLQGARGADPVDLTAVVRVVRAVSNLVSEHPEITEIDLNPVVATASGAVALDALVISADH